MTDHVLPGGAGDAAAAARAARIQDALPPELQPYFDAAFIRSYGLYEEFIYRLVLRVIRETAIQPAIREPAPVEEIAARAKLEPGRALVPLDWMLRLLAARGLVESSGDDRDDAPARYRSRGVLPELDPVQVREEQQRYDPSWLPSYALPETVAPEYPAFLRGEAVGEQVLFSPRRLRLWIDYFSNDNGLYAVNNRVGAVALERALPRRGGAILELGGGLGSGALAVLERLEQTGRRDAIEEYRFTEFVPAFLRRGQQSLQTRYPDLPMRFGSLDMNRPFAEQEVQPGSLAVVYAVNTLHVAHDLEFTLGEVRRALEPGGRLVVSECVRPRPRQPIGVEFVFNLTETFRSPRLHPVHRPSGGFLTPEQWRAVIEAAGYEDVRFLPDVVALRAQANDFFVAAIVATHP